MPSGVYERKPKEKERLRLMIKKIGFKPEKGIRMSPRTEFKKGLIPWNKGKNWYEMRGDNHPSRKPELIEKFKKLWSSMPKAKIKGEKHHNWKGGKTPLIMKIRNSSQCNEWRNKVFEQDNYICFLCGDNKGGNLNAHHIEPLSSIIHKNKISNFEEALDCPLIWDVKNGVTICEICHPKADEVGRIKTLIYK